MNVTINTGRELNWIVTLVMSIIFGYLGVDRFMMGHIGWGLLKLCTAGGFGVWWLIDVILIATRHQYKNVTWI
jgi:TM2 domain-containing membrane protein YozV